MEKAKKISWVRMGEKKVGGCKAVMSRVPLSVGMKELVKNLRVRNRSVKSAKRMTRGVEKMEP